MPTLRRYVPTSDKTGFYLQANVGAGAPVTLQVSRLAARIFTDNGYADADTVPTKLTWAMYDVGLLSTSNSSQQTHKSANVYEAFTQNGVSAQLSDHTRENLIQYLTNYQGPQQRRTRRLKDKLASGAASSRHGASNRVATDDLGYDFTDSVRRIWRHMVAWLRRKQP